MNDMKLTFKEWLKLQEVGTGTNAVATFARPVMPVVRRGPAQGQFGCRYDKQGNCVGLAGEVQPMLFSSWK